MKLAPTVKYNVQDIITKTIPIFYGFFIFIFLLLFILSRIPSMHMNGSFSGISINSTILLIILGLVYTRPSFRFLKQMGVNHKTQIAAKVIGILLISAVVVVADRLIDVIATNLFKSSYVTYESSELFLMPFINSLTKLQPFSREMTIVGLAFASRVMIYAAAVLIAMLYVRMSAITKVVVTIGVPLIVIFGSDQLGRFSQKPMGIRFFNKISEITGLSDGQPIKSILCMAGATVIFFALLYLAMRRAPVND
jgi:hypothetical protein